MAHNLADMSDAELIALRADIDKELARKAVQKKADAKRALELTAKEHGFTLQELLASKTAGGKAPSVAKFANPENPAQTWTGKGRQPTWYKDAIAAGKSADDMAV